jgi:hypothetical protein
MAFSENYKKNQFFIFHRHHAFCRFGDLKIGLSNKHSSRSPRSHHARSLNFDSFYWLETTERKLREKKYEIYAYI